VSSAQLGLLASSLRPGHPDLLDLPWQLSLDRWDAAATPRFERLPSGLSRHPVVFVNYEGAIYALKQLTAGHAEREYTLLREMLGRKLPAVTPVGHVRVRHGEGDGHAETSVLVTRFLDRSLPYVTLFQRGQLARYREHLLDAMAILLVQLHLAGVFWGDCSLDNALFRRDAGALQAYLVDAETSEAHPSLSDGQRDHDLTISEENICGALLDLIAQGLLDKTFPVYETGAYLRSRYETLWHEIQHEERLGRDEGYRVQERIRGLNQLGFSVDEVTLAAAEGGQQLRLRVLVADRNFHRNQLATLTGIDAEENQARLMLNEIHELKARLSATRDRSVPLSAAAFVWQEQVFEPLTSELSEPADLPEPLGSDGDLVERYCELLEHKWYLSEVARRDVGHQRALEDYLGRAAKDDSDAST
jgi:hypothetical protein